jgi:hypothetical protein
LLLSCGWATASAAPMTPAEALADFAAVERALRDIHVDPTSVLGPEAFEAAIVEVRGALGAIESDRDFWIAVAPFVASIGDGHTYLLPPVYRLPEDQRLRAELSVVVRGDTLLLVAPGTVDCGAPVAREVATVDGRAATEVVRGLRAGISGEFVPFRNSWLNEDFDLLYPWWAPSDGPVRLVLADGTPVDAPVTHSPSHRVSPPTAPEGWRWTSAAAGVTVLDIDSFELDRRAWRRSLKEGFRSLRDEGATALVLDVRGNPGGQSYRLEDLLPYLMKPWRVYSEVQIRRATPEGPWTPPMVRTPREWNYRMTPHWDGPVVVLTDGATFSTATDLAVVLSDYRRARIVGEVPGGAPTSTGNLTPVPLPSGNLLYVASARFLRADPSRGVGPLEVDLPVEGARALEAAVQELTAGT